MAGNWELATQGVDMFNSFPASPLGRSKKEFSEFLLGGLRVSGEPIYKPDGDLAPKAQKTTFVPIAKIFGKLPLSAGEQPRIFMEDF